MFSNSLLCIYQCSWFMCSFLQEIKALLALRGKPFQPSANFKEKVCKLKACILILCPLSFDNLRSATSEDFCLVGSISPQSLLGLSLLFSLLSGVWMACLRRMSVASWPDLFVQSKCWSFVGREVKEWSYYSAHPPYPWWVECVHDALSFQVCVWTMGPWTNTQWTQNIPLELPVGEHG